MGRSWKIAIGAAVVAIALLGANALVTGAETKPAEVTEPGGRILELQGGEMQVVERGPRNRPAIVLLHCFTCAIDWWDGMTPRLRRDHRVVAVDLLGHGGSEKPGSGYTIENQANLVAQALNRLGVRKATVAGHSLGGPVAVALAERSPQLVDRLVIIDSRSSADDEGDLGILANLAFTPVVGEALWRIKPDFAVSQGLEVAFAPGFDVPDAFVEDVNRMTFSAYDESTHDDFDDEKSLAERIAATHKPLLVIMGAEEQIIDDPQAALANFARAVPWAQTKLIADAGHSPNVEKPAQTAALVLAFDASKRPAKSGYSALQMQDLVQKTGAVRSRP